MSEQLHDSPEHKIESIDTSAETKHNAERLREESEKTPEIDAGTVERLHHKAEDEAVSGKEITVGERQESSSTAFTINKDLKQQSYKKTLQRIRASLPAPQRILSRIVHQPTVEKISTVGAATAARPSGILGGAIFAFLGSVSLVILSKRLGFTYNYLVFFVLFVGGFAVGLIVELMVRFIIRPSKRSGH